MTNIPRLPPNPRRSRLAPYQLLPVDMSLKDELCSWRREAAIAKFGAGNVRMLGPGLIMANSVVERIVNAAHYLKINDIDDLRKESQWEGSAEHAAEVVELICKLRPSTALVTTPLQLRQANSSTSGIPLVKKMIHCSQCGQVGHNGMSF